MVDLLVIGGGINGAGIARDAAGRGLSVVLVERGDLAGGTSSASSKLIHGGLRYLEQFEFRLVAEALAERETLLRVARHLVWPARFIAPHVTPRQPGVRPRWMIRIGLFLYDHLARRSLLAGSAAVRLDAAPYRSGLKPELRHGFIYSDCRVDDARLVIANALDAERRGARILVRTECLSARRIEGAWEAALADGERVRARALVNAAGPAVKSFLDERAERPSKDNVRLVRGSHIVLPKLYEGDHAFILQNDDGRVVFMIPYEDAYTLVGTTDVPQADLEPPAATDEEVAYLCRAVNRYLALPVQPSQVLWRYAGVRPLHDDGSADPSAVTRDYTLRVEDEAGAAPVLSVYGGKITTYRKLAEHALDELRPYFPGLRGSWTGDSALPGSDFRDRQEALREVRERYARVPDDVVHAVFRRHGSLAPEVLGDGITGEHYGAGLCEREVDYFKRREWAREAADVLWRRTKAGLRLDVRQQSRVAEALAR
ncbi:MAG: glycerol-3-phosphate dehydrogenase [Betaproteobacteria bacterium]|nr:glycerol-3-phosphate dehydrogenase [Betaproteobacteria bacterium]